MKAEFEVTILEDGVISVKTGAMQGEHHQSADEFLKLITELAGGTRETKSTREHGHHHHHHHGDHHHTH